MSTVELVTAFIDENILNSKAYDKASDPEKKKAVNQAVNTLKRYMSDTYKEVDVIPVEDVAEQVIWLFKLDDSFARAEMGATMITVDGIQLQMSNMDRTISPKLLSFYGLSAAGKAKSRAMPYKDEMDFRSGMGRDNKVWRSWR